MENHLSRRSALLAIGTAGAVVSVPAIAATEPAPPDPTEDTPYNDGFADGLALGLEAFALGWLDRWTAHGGSAYMGKKGKAADWAKLEPKLMIGFPTYHFSPVAEDNENFYAEWRTGGLAALSEKDREWHLQQRRSADQHFHEGKVRELYDLLEAVPGAYEAIERVVRDAPGLGVGRQRKTPRFNFSAKEA